MDVSKDDQYHLLKISAESLRPRKNGSGDFQPRNETRRKHEKTCVSLTELSINSTIAVSYKQKTRQVHTSNSDQPSHSLTPSHHMLAASVACLRPAPPPQG